MAPWSRSHPLNLQNNPSSNSVSPNTATSARTRLPSRVTEADILENAYGIPTLTPSDATSSNPTRIASHGRSLSHPIVSLFNGKKKRNGDYGNGFESTDDDIVSPVQVRQISQNPAAKPVKIPDKDFLTGKCMTCDSTVRWPKNLNVFRCTVCMTINDLKPIMLEARRGDGQRVAVKGGHYPSVHSHQVSPISIEKTRKLIDQCITAYLLDRLRHDGGDTSGSLPQSPYLAGTDVPRDQELSFDVEETPQFDPETPIHLSEYPIDLPTAQSISRRGLLQESSSIQSAPYSTSFPGTFPDLQMELRDPSPQLAGPNGSGKEKAKHEGYFDTYYSSEQRQHDRSNPKRSVEVRNLFKPVEEYIIASFASFENLNSSFSTLRPSMAPRAASEGSKRNQAPKPVETPIWKDEILSELDAKTLLLGDFAENGSWWTGGRDAKSPERSRTHRTGDMSFNGSISHKSPRIDWVDLSEWYSLVLNAGRSWQKRLDELSVSELHTSPISCPSDKEMEEIDGIMMEAQFHAQRVLLKATESFLKRPGRPLRVPEDLRFLLIILANPLLYPSPGESGSWQRTRSRSRSRDKIYTYKPAGHDGPRRNIKPSSPPPSNINRGSSGQHSGIIKRILGLLSNAPNECHHHLISWFARYSDGQFHRIADLIGSFVTYRLTRQHGKRREVDQDPTAGLIPDMSRSGRSTSAALHTALSIAGQPSKKSVGKPQPVIYNDDWQIKAAARVMALIFAANNSGLSRRRHTRPVATMETGHSAGLAARERAHIHGQILPTSDFYNTLLDYSDLVADFEAWEGRRGKFAFCQYPFFLSIWAKIQIMEYDARRQMEVKAREAFFDSIMTHKIVNQYLVLKIRRDCLVEDSLKGVSEVVGSGGEEIKKGLRIEFKGEEGIDAGGLRKEWFLLLVRDVFNPEHGMFSYDEDSQFCYFNPNSFETTDQFFLVGVVLGLAIYNSTILDVALPPFAFRKLLAAGPVAAPGAMSHAKPSMTYSLEDLAEYRPALASGLRQLLEFEGDVESTFCRDFVAEVERYGQKIQVPLCQYGENKPVTNSNRHDFVDLYVRYLLDTSVARQFEPFKRGFFTVCGGNALSLFRPEEIELLIRGSDEPLDIASLRAVSLCENWGVLNAGKTEPVVQWFWESFQSADPKDQRKLLSFITGSDRIPAMGATNLIIKLSCLGDDSLRFPVARTCFNMLSLYRYSSRQKLESMLWRAVRESEGFGLK